MDYDRYDAFLHHIFKQTQGDAWFRPNEDNIAVGVALRVDNGEYRVFPYENLALEPFEAAIRALNPAVAVKVRSAAVHAAFAEVYVSSPSSFYHARLLTTTRATLQWPTGQVHLHRRQHPHPDPRHHARPPHRR